MLQNFVNLILNRNQNLTYEEYDKRNFYHRTTVYDLVYSVSVTFIIFTGCSVLKRYWSVRSPEKKNGNGIGDIPGPKSLPFMGTRWIYSQWFGIYRLSKVHEAYADLFKQYGDIVREEGLWNIPIVSVVNRESIEKVLKQTGRYPFRPPNEVTTHYRKSRPDRYTNSGLVNEQGEAWHRLRVTLTPELTSNKTMSEFLPELIMVTEDFTSLIDRSRSADNVVVNFEHLCNRLGLESTCTLILGRRFGFLQDGQADDIGKPLADAIRGQFRASQDAFYGLPWWKFFRTAAYDEFIRCEDTIYDIISSLVEEAIQQEADMCPVDNVHKVFRSILDAKDLDVRDKKAAIIDFIAAGIKTLGNSLVFLMYLISKNPRVQEKLYREIQEITTANGERSMESLHKAEYLQACITEAFRLLPTAPCVARILENKVELDGYNLPVGSVVLCHTWLASLRESNFDRADEFLPERWLTGMKPKSACLVIPFGYGRRMCPGKRFVKLELQVVLAQIIQKFEVDFEGDLDLQFEFLLSPGLTTNFTFKNRL